VDPNDLIYDVEPSFQGGNKIAEHILLSKSDNKSTSDMR
jgi:hypothetical protein